MESPAHQEREFEHAKLRDDVEIVRSYGEGHPDEWTEALFDNEPSVRLVALFAGPNRELHEHALRGLVSYPDQLEVREVKYSRRQLEEMFQGVRRMSEFGHPRAFLSTGIARGQLHIQVGADQEQLAATLRARLGDAVDLKVGAFPFPMPAESPSSIAKSRRSTRLETPLISEEGVDVALSGGLEVTSGRSERAFLKFTNRGPNKVVIDTNGGLTARVVDPASDQVVGGFVGMHTLQLIRISIFPGETVTIPILVATASCKNELGYVVPPGNWMIDAVVNVRDVGERRIPLLPIVIVAHSS